MRRYWKLHNEYNQHVQYVPLQDKGGLGVRLRHFVTEKVAFVQP
jgi:hypothetical protein